MKSGIYDKITTWDQLGAISTFTIIESIIVIWVDQSGGKHTSQLRMSDAATDTPNGVRRADDWSSNNMKVWFDC